MVKLMKFDEMPKDGRFGDAVSYRHFFSSDRQGAHTGKDYSGERLKSGYSLCRIAEARRVEKDTGKNVQPYHYHEKRDLYIIGIKGKRSMIANGKRYEIGPGTILYIEPGDAHKSVDIGKRDWVCLELWHANPGDTETIIPEKKSAKAR